MKNILCTVLAVQMLLIGCAGREGNPIAAYRAGDEKRDCVSLQTEIAQLDTEIATLLPKSDKGGYNTVMLITGLFVIIPLFFMDFKNGERVELQACRQRHNALELIAAQKGCDMTGVRADSAEEQKKTNSEPPKDLSIKHAPTEHELVYDDVTRKGYISVQGAGLESRTWMLEKIGEIASSKNIRIQAGTSPTAGYYRILDEKIQDGKYTIKFEVTY